jgi:hypothetical protein
VRQFSDHICSVVMVRKDAKDKGDKDKAPAKDAKDK